MCGHALCKSNVSCFRLYTHHPRLLANIMADDVKVRGHTSCKEVAFWGQGFNRQSLPACVLARVCGHNKFRSLCLCLIGAVGPAAPTEVAEGEETPAETKAEAKPSPGSSHSAAALSGADSASELPQVHAQAAEQAAPAKPVGQQSTEAERTDPLPTAPPPTAAATAVSPSSVPDSVPSGGAGSSSPSAGGLLPLLHPLQC